MTWASGLKAAVDTHMRAGVGKSLWGTTSDGISVYHVNGKAVREKYDVDYTEGGHHYRWNFIPKKEVWVERMKNPTEERANLLHELHERRLMTEENLPYEDAHDKTCPLEEKARRKPTALTAALKKEGWNQ
jgi:hypothetical protein